MTQFVLSGLAVVLFAAGAVAQNSGYATYSNGNGGVCDGVSSGLPAVAMNAAQFGGGAACGQCVQIQGTGNGAGKTPVSTAPYIAVVNNVCPSCAVGDIDLQESGSGKFGITWTFVACPGAGRRLIEGGRKMIADALEPAAEMLGLIPEVDEEESQEATAEQIATPEEALSAAPSQAEPVQEDAYKTEETPETEESSQAATPAADPAEVPVVEMMEVAAPAASPVAAQDIPSASRRMLR